MDMSKECRTNDGPRGYWTGSQIEEGKEEDQGETGERTYKQRWNGETYIVEIGKIENYGMQDAENGDSCKKISFIYICISIQVGLTINDHKTKYLRCTKKQHKTDGIDITQTHLEYVK